MNNIAKIPIIVVLSIFAILLFVYLDEQFEEYYLKLWRRKKHVWDDEKMNSGRNIAAKSGINFCMLARDCRESIEKNTLIIEEWGNLFEDYRVIIFENDSVDGSRDSIRKWASMNNKVKLIECDEFLDCKLKERTGYGLGALSKARIEKMGKYREKYLEEIRNSDFEYSMVIDVDLDLSSVPINGLLTSLAIPGDWDALFHNGRVTIPGTMGTFTIPYDTLAFEKYNTTVKKNGDVFFNPFVAFLHMFLIYGKGEVVRVNSAFNGLALYRTKAMKTGSYINSGSDICEHNVLHASMKNKYTSPSWIGYYSRQGDGSIIKQTVNYFKTYFLGRT